MAKKTHKGLMILQRIAKKSGDHIDDVVACLSDESPSVRNEILCCTYNCTTSERKEVEDYLATL